MKTIKGLEGIGTKLKLWRDKLPFWNWVSGIYLISFLETHYKPCNFSFCWRIIKDFFRVSNNTKRYKINCKNRIKKSGCIQANTWSLKNDSKPMSLDFTRITCSPWIHLRKRHWPFRRNLRPNLLQARSWHI